MLRGINPLSLDSKGRLSIPAKYRDRLKAFCAGQLVVTIDCDPCLLIYPLPVWEEVEQKLIRLSSTNQQARRLKRILIGHAEECQLDSQGRILLPAPLREFAHLDKRVTLVGQGNKFELWEEGAWNRFTKECLTEKSQEAGNFSADLELLSF